MTTMFRYPALAGLLALTACVSAGQSAKADQALDRHFQSQITPYTYVQPAAVPLSSEQQSLVRNTIAGALKDPGSAVFGGYLARQDAQNPSIIHVCGMVNARNSYGGYSGDYPYYGRLVGSSFEIESVDGPGWGRAAGFCDAAYGVLRPVGQ